MKRFYNQESRSIKEFQDYQVIGFKLDVAGTYALNYFRELDKKFEAHLAAQEPTNMPTIFQIIGDFEALSKAKDEDKVYYLFTISNIFVSHIFTDEKMDGEYRLMAPKSLEKVKFSEMVKKDLANRVLKFPNFRLEILDKFGNLIFEVM